MSEKLYRDLIRFANPSLYYKYVPPRHGKKKQYVALSDKDTGKYVPLSDDVIDAHFTGSQPIGLVPVRVSEKGDYETHIFGFDFDDHGGEHADLMNRVFTAWLRFVEEKEIATIPFRSSSGTGYHSWFVTKDPRRVDSVKTTLQNLLAEFNECHGGKTALVEGASGGVSKGEIEFLGVSNGLKPIAWPGALSARRVCLDGDAIVDDDSDDFLFFKLRPGPKGTAMKADRDAAFAALVSKCDPDDYKQWVHYIGMLLVAAFGHDDVWALEKWIAWGSQSDKFDEADARKKWTKIKPTKYTEFSFWKAAREAGYDGEIPFSKKDRDRLAVLERILAVPTLRSYEDETYAEIAPRRWVLVTSREFRRFVHRAAKDESPLLSREIVSQIVDAVDAMAEERSEFHPRFARHGDTCYLAQHDEDATVLRIDKSGWSVCEEPPVRFRRANGAKALPMPEPGTFDDYRDFFNTNDDNAPFHLTSLVSCVVRPGLAAPITVLTGPAGSAKSTMLEASVSLVDPKVGALSGLPSKEDDLVTSAHNSAVVSFDNTSTLARLSDELCRLATGGGLRKRTLYTDSDVTSLDVVRPVFISGIDPTAYAQDLIERMVLIHLFPPAEYIDDETFWTRFNQARPRLLGFVLSLVSKVLTAEPFDVRDLRMVGYAQIGEVVAQALGHGPGWFVDEYRQMLETAADDAADADCVVELIRELVDNAPSRDPVVRKRSKDFLEELRMAVEDRRITANKDDVPKNPRQMSHRINVAASYLRKKGYSITQARGRMWEMYREVASDNQVMAAISSHSARVL